MLTLLPWRDVVVFVDAGAATAFRTTTGELLTANGADDEDLEEELRSLAMGEQEEVLRGGGAAPFLVIRRALVS